MPNFTKYKLVCDNAYGLGNPKGLEQDPEFTRKYTIASDVCEVAKRLFKKYCLTNGDTISVMGLDRNGWAAAGLTIGGHYHDTNGVMLKE